MWQSVIDRLEALWLSMPGLWIRPEVLPVVPAEQIDATRPICYVLEKGGVVDTAALAKMCREHGLPAPMSSFTYAERTEPRAVIVLRRPHFRWLRRSSRTTSPLLERLVVAARESGTEAGQPEIQLVPVSVFWGRSPDREDSVVKLMFSENWGRSGRVERFLKSVVHGRNTLVQFSEPMSLTAITREDLGTDAVVRKVSRILRVHFRQRRIATLGPDLSHRRTLLDRVLRQPAVRAQINLEAGGEARALSRAEGKALGYANEIAANLSYPTVRVLRKALTWLWNKLYDGVQTDGVDRLNRIADGSGVVYVPCHRSHIDYLLLSYLLYMQGLSLPHIAAGKNLNIPVVGPILRRGGAFFLRRSFRDNKLYGAVFRSYLQEIIHRGHALEYFIEGGRSRTGRLLKPKGGMLVMTVQAYLQHNQRPLAFVPVYFGYERLVEGGSFASELSGGKKQKESLLGLLRSLGILRQKFGSVYVNFAEPVVLADLLNDHHPGWAADSGSETRPDWLQAVIDDLGDKIQKNINAAASITPVSLLALALLTSQRGRLAETDLLSLIDFFCRLQVSLPYSQSVVVTSRSATDIVSHGVELGYIESLESDLGAIVSIRPRRRIPMSFFRNNVLHLYAIPSLIACCFHNQSAYALADIKKLVKLSYPYLQAELYLRWSDEELSAEVDKIIAGFVKMDLLHRVDDNDLLSRAVAGSEQTFVLLSLGELVLPSLQRYFLTVSLLSRLGSGVVDADTLGEHCQRCAERLEAIHGSQSPDFYDRALFRGFIDALLQQEILILDEQGRLHFEPVFANIDAQTRPILSEQIRHSILNITSRVAVPA